MNTKSKIAPTVGVISAVLALSVSAVAVAAKPGRANPLPQGGESVNLNPADFATDIDNPYWPMKPGSRWVYRETDSKGARRRVVVTVTDQIKETAIGIKARVIHDVVTEGGKPVEVTDDYYAQDRAGNIWYFGEATAEYENGKVATREGSFEAGVDGAQPGVILPARPKVGLRYREEYYKGHAEDRAQVVSLREQVEVPFGYFRAGRVLMTRNQDRLEPKVLEYKFMARGIGPVLEVSVSGGSDRAELLSFRPGK
jgi:hypothetical protein